MSRWSNQEIERLFDLRRMGLSATDIGDEMGRTRDSVLGKVERLRGKLYSVPPSLAKPIGGRRKRLRLPAVVELPPPCSSPDDVRRWEAWKRARDGARDTLAKRRTQSSESLKDDPRRTMLQ